MMLRLVQVLMLVLLLQLLLLLLALLAGGGRDRGRGGDTADRLDHHRGAIEPRILGVERAQLVL